MVKKAIEKVSFLFKRVTKADKDSLNNKRYFNKLFESVAVKDDTHREYLETQLTRTLIKRDNSSAKRVKYLLQKLIETATLPKSVKILSVGCRNIYEIKSFWEMGFNNVTGIDLYSEDPSILIMDMHDMKFNNNTFDVVYCAHALEHSFDHEKVIKELIRVGKQNAIIVVEIPVNYEMGGADLLDFGSLKDLYNEFNAHVNINKVFFEEELKKGEAKNFAGTDIVRAIFDIEKGSNI